MTDATLKPFLDGIKQVITNVVDDKLLSLHSKMEYLSGNMAILNSNVAELLLERDVTRYNRAQDDIAFVSMMTDMKNSYNQVIKKLSEIETSMGKVPCLANPDIYESVLTFKSPYFDTSTKLFLILDLSLKVVLVNENLTDLLGFYEEEVLHKNWVNTFIPKDDQVKVSDVFDDMLNKGVNAYSLTQHRVLTKDGKEIMVKWQNTVIRGKDCKSIAIIKMGELVDGSTKAD